MAMEQITKCDLVIPHKQWALNLVPILSKVPGIGSAVQRYAQQEFENLKSVEVWARRFRKECVTGGATMCGDYFNVVGESTDDVAGDFTSVITLDSSATVKVDVTATTYNRVSCTILPYVDGFNVIGPVMASIAVPGSGGVDTASTALTYITTLDAGTHTIGFSLSDAVGDTAQEIVASITWIIGLDTGCDNVQIGGGA